MSVFDSLDWSDVRQHYGYRMGVHRDLIEFHQRKSVADFANLALGITDAFGNCSANQHGLGPKILATNLNAAKQVFDLAGRFLALKNASRVPELVRNANVSNLQIGVGSEISCMVNPKVCWVVNARTIWTHLVFKHAENLARAEEELRLYREGDSTSEMYYPYWSAIHADLDASLRQVAEAGRRRANSRRCHAG